MCMICRGLELRKYTAEEARERFDEMYDLIDEEHLEEVEELLAEYEEEEEYLTQAKKNYYNRDEEPYFDEDELDDGFHEETFDEDDD